MAVKINVWKTLFCLTLCMCSCFGIAFMEPNSGETMEQAKALGETAEEEETFLLQDVAVDSELDESPKNMREILDGYAGHRASMEDLMRLARDLTRAYRTHGYLAAVAYLPEQEIRDGKVIVRVISGRFGDVMVDNQSRLDKAVIDGIKENLRLGSVVEGKQIENVLYRINALGGVKATGQLVKPEGSDAIRLIVTVVDDQRTRDIVYGENCGNEYSGRYRLGIVHNSYNIDHHGGNLEVGVLLSNKNLQNYHIDYSILSDAKSTSRAGLSVGRTSYSLTEDYDVLDAGGNSNDVSLYGRTTLLQSLQDGMELSYGCRYREISDEIGAFGLSTKKHSLAVYGGIHGYTRVPRGILNYSLTLTAGNLSNDSDYARLLNAYNHTEGQFLKAEGKLDYLQAIHERWQFHTTLSWQQASKPLDSSEKFYLGGINGVRAYAAGSGSGDQGFLSRTEFIYQTKAKGLSLSAFFDIGSVGSKSGTLHTMRGYGIGLNYRRPDDYFLQMVYAWKLGDSDAVSSDRDKGRFWFLCGKVL